MILSGVVHWESSRDERHAAVIRRPEIPCGSHPNLRHPEM